MPRSRRRRRRSVPRLATSPKLGDFSKLREWLAHQPVEEQDESCPHDSGGSDGASEAASDAGSDAPSEPLSPVPAFIPRDFLAKLDFSKITILSSSSTTSSPPAQEDGLPSELSDPSTHHDLDVTVSDGESSTPTSAPTSSDELPSSGETQAVSYPFVNVRDISTSEGPWARFSPDSFPLCELSGFETAEPKPFAFPTIHHPIRPISQHQNEPENLCPSWMMGPQKDVHPKPQRQAIHRYNLQPDVKSFYQKALAEAECFMAKYDHSSIRRYINANYQLVDQHTSPTVYDLRCKMEVPWFCPVPPLPLSQLGFVAHHEFKRSELPILTPHAINPVYIASKKTKARLIIGRVVIEFMRDAVLESDNSFEKGIHIFVDLSNIICGFRETIMRLRGIDKNTWVSDPHFFFEGLSRILERGRYIAKRVIAGSTKSPSDRSTWPTYMTDAEKLGYEMNILHRVTKPEDIRRRASGRRYASNDFGKWTSSSDEAELEVVTTTGRPRKAEQAVDEILHLKMCESILDCDGAATMILATGDGAAGEFSAGFVAQVERALARGWHVELVTWRANLSSQWNKLMDPAKWGDRFRVIYLDWCVEELFDCGLGY